MYINPSINTFGDAGYSYQISYTVIPPVLITTLNPNSSFATVQTINPNLTVEGHLDFYNHTDDEYFGFTSPIPAFEGSYFSRNPGVVPRLQLHLIFRLRQPSKSVPNKFILLSVLTARLLPILCILQALPRGFYYLKVYNAVSVLRACRTNSTFNSNQ